MERDAWIGDKANGECRPPTAESPKFKAGDHGSWDLMKGKFDEKHTWSLGIGRLITLRGGEAFMLFIETDVAGTAGRIWEDQMSD